MEYVLIVFMYAGMLIIAKKEYDKLDKKIKEFKNEFKTLAVGYKLSNINLEEANLSNANLNGADLNNAKLNNANLYKANLKNTILDN